MWLSERCQKEPSKVIKDCSVRARVQQCFQSPQQGCSAIARPQHAIAKNALQQSQVDDVF